MNVVQNIHGISGLRLTVVEERDTAESGRYWVRSLIVTGRNGEEFRVEMFGDSPQALTLVSERLDAYAAQARESDPLLSPPREPLLSPVRRKTANCCECNGEYPAIDLHEGGEDRCPRCREQARSCLPETEGEVDLVAEANPPRFQIGDRVMPVKAGDGLLAGKAYTVDDVHFHSVTGEELTGVEGSDRRWSNTAFRLADEPTF